MRELICAPVYEFGTDFYANVDFLDDPEWANLSREDLLSATAAGYPHSFFMIVDGMTMEHGEAPVLVVDAAAERGRSFRAVPTQIQSIENNLSLANMDFFEFADNVDADGIFRGFGS